MGNYNMKYTPFPLEKTKQHTINNKHKNMGFYGSNWGNRCELLTENVLHWWSLGFLCTFWNLRVLSTNYILEQKAIKMHA